MYTNWHEISEEGIKKCWLLFFSGGSVVVADKLWRLENCKVRVNSGKRLA